MLRFHLVDNINPALAADNLIIWTDFLYAGTDFHPDHLLSKSDTLLTYLILAVGNPTLRQIVRRQFYLNAVSGHEADVMFPHPAGDMSYDLMAILEFNLKRGARQRLSDGTRQFDDLFLLSHKYNEEIVANSTRSCKVLFFSLDVWYDSSK